MRHPGRVFSLRFLIKEVWETDYVGDCRTLEVHVYILRGSFPLALLGLATPPTACLYGDRPSLPPLRGHPPQHPLSW
jgi:hypothetical protein